MNKTLIGSAIVVGIIFGIYFNGQYESKLLTQRYFLLGAARDLNLKYIDFEITINKSNISSMRDIEKRQEKALNLDTTAAQFMDLYNETNGIGNLPKYDFNFDNNFTKDGRSLLLGGSEDTLQLRLKNYAENLADLIIFLKDI